MRTNGDILGHLSKGVNNASIFVPQSDEAVEETPDNKQVEDENTNTLQAIETEFEMEFETEDTEDTDISPDEIEAEEIACYMGAVSRKWHRVLRWENWRKWYRSFK